MDAKDVLLDIFQSFAFALHYTLEDMPDEALQWQTDSEANDIAVTVWHICRALDMLKVKIIENHPTPQQLWYSQGWAARTGYDPAGLGFGGFGNLAGYTLDEVKRVPRLSADELLEYFDQVYEALSNYLANLPLEALEQPPAGWPDESDEDTPQSVYEVTRMFLMDNREHLGEIKAIKALWYRKSTKQ